MIPIIFAALCVAVAAAESSSVSSHSTVPSNMRDYEYASPSYLTSKPNYSDLGTTSYITSAGSPYAKSDSRLYSAADPSSDSSSGSSSSSNSNNNNEARASTGLSGSYYKSKYGSEAVVNALRPSAFHTSSSSSSSASSPSLSSSSSSSSQPSEIQSNHYPGSSNDYSSSYPSPSDFGQSSSGFTGSFGQREHHSQHHAYLPSEMQQQQQPEYVGTRPTGTIYGSYASAEYQQSRPTAYATHSSGISGPPSDYSHHPHTVAHYPTAEEYSAPAPHYKTYVMSSAPSYPTSKYSTVLGAIKSLFGGGSGGPMLSDPAPSATHLSSYQPMGPSSSGYYSPGLMHSATHHMPVAASAPAPPGYYLNSGKYSYASSLAPSTSAYSKSYAPMRLMSGYGGNGAPGSKVIVVRDSGSAHLGASYPATAGLLMSSSSSYPVKSKISFGPSSAGPSYIPSPSSLQSFTSGSPSSSYPASYSSSSGFANGGSTFLGYSM